MTKISIRKVRIEENMGGHDGSASGGHYGSFKTLFGIFPDEAVEIGGENSDAIHTWEPTGLHYHRDKWSKGYMFHSELLRLGDFIAIRNSSDDQRSISGGEIRIIAHRLPVGEIPSHWKRVSGYSSMDFHGYYSCKGSFFRRASDGEQVSWIDTVQELGLAEIPHPFGKLWVSPEGVGVAVNSMPIYFSDLHNDTTQTSIFGDVEFFHNHGFVVVDYEQKDDRIISWSSSQEIILRKKDKSSLERDGYYPVQVTPNMVVWGTGLHLYPKHLEWQVGLNPACGTPEEEYLGAVGRGTRVFDSSPERLQRLEEFFFESIGKIGVRDPKAEYIRFANYQDPRKGRWGNSHHYPKESWKPHFEGWGIDRFGTVECRWKQPKRGAARYYGIVR